MDTTAHTLRARNTVCIAVATKELSGLIFIALSRSTILIYREPLSQLNPFLIYSINMNI